MRANTGAGHSEYEETVIRGNLYAVKRKRRQPGSCKCCHGQINKGEIVYVVEKNDGFKRVFHGLVHIECFGKL